MSNEPTQLQQMKPYLIAAGVLFVILLGVMFWPSEKPQETSVPIQVEQSPTTSSPEPVAQAAEELGITDMVEPEVFQSIPQPTETVINPGMEIEEFEAEEVEVEVPLDTSDATVKTALLAVANSPTFGKFLVNDGLIQKFVINVHNLAQANLSPKDTFVVPPEETFKTYNQADRIWIDRTSFQRYTPYVEALESLETDELLTVYENYREVIEEKFAEISRPGADFDNSLLRAIDELLDTPQVPVPIEVYSESVMYKFKDPKLEALSAPQKQLLRTGPENMRRIKEVLRELKDEIEAQN
jgi:hypothetical protein